jgi:hypothetical protein
MTATPDADHGITDEQQEAIGAALAQYAEAAPFPANALQDMIDDLLPTLAAIRRQAAADALREQARSLTKTASSMREQARAHDANGKRDSSIIYNSLADAYYGSASRLWVSADNKIAEGYEHTCAAQTWATRDDPGHDCENPVENEGDYCDRHEPEDDDDRWAE